MDKLRALRYFIKVAETENFTEAARTFAVPASSISRRIKDLESSLDISLFIRSTRAVHLTELGRLYYAEAKKILTAMEQADNLVSQQSQTPSGLLRITCTPVLGELKLLPSLNRLRSQYPDIVFDVHFTDEILDLSGYALDIAIRSTSTLPDTLIARKLFAHRFSLVAAPAFIKKYTIPETIKELEQLPAILYRGPSKIMQWQSLNEEKWTEVNTKAAFISNHGQSLLDAALNGEGIALFPEWGVHEYITSNRLLEIKLQDTLFSLTRDTENFMYLLYHPPKFRLQKVRVVIDFLQEDLAGNNV